MGACCSKEDAVLKFQKHTQTEKTESKWQEQESGGESVTAVASSIGPALHEGALAAELAFASTSVEFKRSATVPADPSDSGRGLGLPPLSTTLGSVELDDKINKKTVLQMKKGKPSLPVGPRCVVTHRKDSQGPVESPPVATDRPVQVTVNPRDEVGVMCVAPVASPVYVAESTGSTILRSTSQTLTVPNPGEDEDDDPRAPTPNVAATHYIVSSLPSGGPQTTAHPGEAHVPRGFEKEMMGAFDEEMEDPVFQDDENWSDDEDELYCPAVGNPAVGSPAVRNPAVGNPAVGNSLGSQITPLPQLTRDSGVPAAEVVIHFDEAPVRLNADGFWEIDDPEINPPLSAISSPQNVPVAAPLPAPAPAPVHVGNSDLP